MTILIPVPKDQLEQLYSALVLGRDSVATESANYHESHKGYRQDEHDLHDKNVEEMLAAINLMQELINSPPLKIEAWADGLCSYPVYQIPTEKE